MVVEEEEEEVVGGMVSLPSRRHLLFIAAHGSGTRESWVRPVARISTSFTRLQTSRAR